MYGHDLPRIIAKMLDPDVKARPTVPMLLTDPWIREQVSLYREELCTQVETARAKEKAKA